MLALSARNGCVSIAVTNGFNKPLTIHTGLVVGIRKQRDLFERCGSWKNGIDVITLDVIQGSFARYTTTRDVPWNILV